MIGIALINGIEYPIGFKITGGKGFHITFENGWTISVQFGPGNYCDNYGMSIGGKEDIEAGKGGSTTAECAIFNPDGEMIEHKGWGNIVSSRSTPAEVLKYMSWTAKQKSK